jgi:peptide/nickel transport system substrate-binding protein
MDKFATGSVNDAQGLSAPRGSATDVTRRDLLKVGALGGLTIGAGGLLGIFGNSPQPAWGAAAAKPKRGGTLRIGVSAGGSNDAINPLLLGNPPDYARVFQIYEPLIAWDENLNLVPYLAESMTPNADATLWTIKVRKGVTFHDGKPLTAADVAYTFQTILNPKSPGYGASSIQNVDAKNIKVLDTHTVQIPCLAPFSTFMETLPVYQFCVIPVGFNPSKPNGTGPFKFQSFTPGVQSVMVRNPNYWQPGLPYVDKLILIDFADETSQTNALASGQVDAIGMLSAPSIATVKSQGNGILISNGGGFSPFTMRVDVAPFSDVRVRQALRLVVDRPQLMNIVFGGHGTLGNDVFSRWSSDYDTSLPQRHQDLEKAKSLLKQAGHEGLTAELVVAPQAQGAIVAAQVFQQQATGAGVKINIRQITTTAFASKYPNWTFANSFWFANPYFQEVGISTLPTSPYNETHFNDPKYTALYAEGLKTVNPSKRKEIAAEMQTIDYDIGGLIIPCFAPIIDGFSSKLRGDKKSKSGLPFNDWDLKSLWFE